MRWELQYFAQHPLRPHVIVCRLSQVSVGKYDLVFHDSIGVSVGFEGVEGPPVEQSNAIIDTMKTRLINSATFNPVLAFCETIATGLIL